MGTLSSADTVGADVVICAPASSRRTLTGHGRSGPATRSGRASGIVSSRECSSMRDTRLTSMASASRARRQACSTRGASTTPGRLRHGSRGAPSVPTISAHRTAQRSGRSREGQCTGSVEAAVWFAHHRATGKAVAPTRVLRTPPTKTTRLLLTQTSTAPTVVIWVAGRAAVLIVKRPLL
jgi:hypothetical protein